MPTFARKSPETDNDEKPSKHNPGNWNLLCPNQSTTPPPSIQARPALRAPRPDPRVKPARDTPLEAGDRKERQLHPSSDPLKPDISNMHPAPERARLGTELQQLYAQENFAEITRFLVDAYLPKDALATSSPNWSSRAQHTTRLAFLAERMLEMNKQKQQMINGLQKSSQHYCPGE